MYVGGNTPSGATPLVVSDDVVEWWRQAKQDLESLGAEVILAPDFPVVTGYENDELLPEDLPRRSADWMKKERGPLVAHAWNNFLISNQDPKTPNIASVNELEIYPDSMMTPPELKNMDLVNYSIPWTKLAGYVEESSLCELEGLDTTVPLLERMRKALLDNYLAKYKCHCFAFPAAGDVGAENADVDDVSAQHAFSNGVFYSNGNRALHHLGVPTTTVPMGIMAKKRMPVGLTFAGRAYDDINLLKWAYAFEQKTKNRVAPPMTPPLKSDIISLSPHSPFLTPKI